MPQDPDENDAYSGYRPDMDQHREPDPHMPGGWWILPAAVGGGIIMAILLGLWIFT